MTDAAIAATTEDRVYTLGDGGYTWLTDKIAKLTKRADKLGVPAPTIEVVEIVDRSVIDEILGDTGVIERVYKVKVHGESPKYDGWRLAAVIDRDLEEKTAPNVIRAVPGETVDPEWRWLADVCDHCGHIPRGRKSLVVVRTDTGDERIVGLTCLRDFLGDRSPATIASWAEAIAGLHDLVGLAEDEDRAGTYGGGEWRVAPGRYLGWVVAAIEKYGWVPRSKRDFAEPTADEAAAEMSKRDPKTRLFAPTDDDFAWAERALEWAESLPLEPTNRDGTFNDYLGNVRAVAAKSGWRRSDLGIGASIAAAYRREVEFAARAFRVDDDEEFGIPAPEGKVEVVGQVIKTAVTENDYGIRYVMTIKIRNDEGGAWRGWLTIPAALSREKDVEVGDVVKLTATWKRSDRDAAFAFGSRPSKAAFVTKVAA